MAAVLEFRCDQRRNRRQRIVSSGEVRRECEIVIFPGPRIDRQTLDLGHRIAKKSGDGDAACRPSDGAS